MARKLGVYMSPPLEELVKDREDMNTLSGRLSTVAERYLKIIEAHKPDLTEAEWNACRDALNGVWINDASTIAFAWASIYDADEDGLGEKWGVDAQALAKRVREFDAATLVAFIESLETWWATQA